MIDLQSIQWLLSAEVLTEEPMELTFLAEFSPELFLIMGKIKSAMN